MQIPEALVELLRREATIPAPMFALLADRVRVMCGAGVDAILLYGSCLRAEDAKTGVVDLFVIVDDYRRAPGGTVRQALNALLPPNVYFLEIAGDPDTLRCKYAVISMQDFEKGTGDWLQPYLWARFAQPSRLLFARDESIRDRLCRCLASAVVAFLRNVAAVMGGETLTARELWGRGFSLTYAAELRPEARDRPERLTTADNEYFDRVTAAAGTALADLAVPAGAGRLRFTAAGLDRQKGLWRWRLRRWQGPLLSVLRWIKAAFTFTGGVDYAAWKIERHTGVRIEITERLRRHPLIYGWPVLWRLWRSGALR